ncbi:MAG: ATP-binding protein [Acidobacteria bacterium]|nr:ATP-binding protein [Acidobacteriota bacterium]
MPPSTILEIERLIRDQVQENIHLDYKASKAITLAARDEIAKDVSAFANSDGGVLVYGVEEKDHLPVRIDDGVDDAVCSREWIENTITSRISPKVSDVRILPLPLSPGRSLYVISVAKSFRGPHQASDKRFYKRHNFKSEPMEEYEINDVRNRRERVSPLVTFEIFDYRRFVAAFDVSNVSDLVAEDVDFAFMPDIPWPEEGKPPLFANGIRKFPPKQQFRFLYFPFHQILNEANQIPSAFSVSIGYYHPQFGRRVVDEWPVNFEAFRHSMAIRSEIEEQVKDVAEGLKKLTEQVQAVNRSMEKFLPIAGSTGLDLSIPALRGLKRAIVDGKEPAPIHPKGCDFGVIREILGTDPEMSRAIWLTLGHRYSPERLKDIPGMTDDLMTRIRASFVLEPDLDKLASDNQPNGG